MTFDYWSIPAAITVAVLGWVIYQFVAAQKKTKEPEYVEHTIWALRILLRTGHTFGWTNPSHDLLARPFLHWYFGRPQSENFMMEYKIGKRLLKRSEIVSFSLGKEISRRTGEVPPG